MHIVATIDVPDLTSGIEFYGKALGFTERVRPFPIFAVMTNGDARIGLMAKHAGTKPAPGSDDTRSYARHWTPVHLDFHVDDFDATISLVELHGGTIEQHAGGGNLPRVAFCCDPFGHGFCIIGPSTDSSASTPDS
ncbi:VOC family protein [Erythrobacter sp.]|uniref:VOC family protein n=1 Tax=Erythrobacter sp. TaxID=1042 RepID=UPI00311FB5E2